MFYDTSWVSKRKLWGSSFWTLYWPRVKWDVGRVICWGHALNVGSIKKTFRVNTKLYSQQNHSSRVHSIKTSLIKSFQQRQKEHKLNRADEWQIKQTVSQTINKMYKKHKTNRIGIGWNTQCTLCQAQTTFFKNIEMQVQKRIRQHCGNVILQDLM